MPGAVAPVGEQELVRVFAAFIAVVGLRASGAGHCCLLEHVRQGAVSQQLGSGQAEQVMMGVACGWVRREGSDDVAVMSQKKNPSEWKRVRRLAPEIFN